MTSTLPGTGERGAEEFEDPAGIDERRSRRIGLVLVVGGLVGAGSALVLLIEKIRSLTDPGYVPSCSVDAVLSCGSVMRSAQAELLGFPNPVIGLVSLPVVAMLGALVAAGVVLPRWTWYALQFGACAGLGFVVWLMVQSTAVIGALCPWCMVVWAAVIAVTWYVTVHTMEDGLLGGGPAARFLVRHHLAVLVLAYAAVVAVVVAAFPAYWGAYVGL